MRRARIDSTHIEIRNALRRCGWLVKDVHALPNWIDLTAYHPATGRFALIDAKGPKGKPEPSQQKLIDDGWPIHFLRSAEDAAKL